MEQKTNKYYAIAYQLYTILDGQRNLEEEAPASDPFIFISGFGTTIPGFEKNILSLEQGQQFDFTVTKDEAYGDYMQEAVLELDKSIFSLNGQFDSNTVFEGAVIPLQNAEGRRFPARVLAVTDDKVKVDLNHPLAGCDLNFVGTVVECREATNEDIQNEVNRLSGGCGGGCGSCSGGCGGCSDGGCSDGGCGGGSCGCH